MRKFLFVGSILCLTIVNSHAQITSPGIYYDNMYSGGYPGGMYNNGYGNMYTGGNSSGMNSNYNNQNGLGNSLTPWSWNPGSTKNGVSTPVASSVAGNRMNRDQKDGQGNNNDDDSNGKKDGKDDDKNKDKKKDDDKKKKKQQSKPVEQPLYIGSTIKGRAIVINALTLKINGHRLVLDNLMAPFPQQMCGSKSGLPWQCGVKTQEQITNMLSDEDVECRIKSTGDIPLVTCDLNGDDLGKRLVETGFYIGRNGHYADELKQAKDDHRGIW